MLAGIGPERGTSIPAPYPGAAVVPLRLLGPQVGRGSDLPHHYRRRVMRRMTWSMCCLILGTGLVPAFAHRAEEAQKKLQGTWAATKAERDGKAADVVVAHRLSLA